MEKGTKSELSTRDEQKAEVIALFNRLTPDDKIKALRFAKKLIGNHHRKVVRV